MRLKATTSCSANRSRSRRRISISSISDSVTVTSQYSVLSTPCFGAKGASAMYRLSAASDTALYLSMIVILAMCRPLRSADASNLTASRLRCEYLTNPLGIDEKQPRLSWIVQSRERGQKQTAYRILVASNEDTLKENRGDEWDTGKVTSDETSGIVYGGKPLTSHTRRYWKVQVWDKDDKPSAWS